MKVLAIVQARLDSQRLPNKVLFQIPPESGMSMLEMVIRKVVLAKLVDKVVVATPDVKIAKFVDMLFPNVTCYVKGFEGRDVLREFCAIARQENMHLEGEGIIVRVTADCVLIQPDIIDDCIRAFINADVDICYNTDESTGQLDGEGSDVEVFNYKALDKAYLHSKQKDEIEHVTLWMRRNLKKLFVPCKKLGVLSVNTYEDYIKVCEIVKNS